MEVQVLSRTQFLIRPGASLKSLSQGVEHPKHLGQVAPGQAMRAFSFPTYSPRIPHGHLRPGLPDTGWGRSRRRSSEGVGRPAQVSGCHQSKGSTRPNVASWSSTSPMGWTPRHILGPHAGPWPARAGRQVRRLVLSAQCRSRMRRTSTYSGQARRSPDSCRRPHHNEYGCDQEQSLGATD